MAILSQFVRQDYFDTQLTIAFWHKYCSLTIVPASVAQGRHLSRWHLYCPKMSITETVLTAYFRQDWVSFGSKPIDLLERYHISSIRIWVSIRRYQLANFSYQVSVFKYLLTGWQVSCNKYQEIVSEFEFWILSIFQIQNTKTPDRTHKTSGGWSCAKLKFS